MSTQRITYGLIAVLTDTIDNNQRQDLFDQLQEDELYVNYEGTLIYWRTVDGESYDVEMICGKNNFGNISKFIELCTKNGISIQEDSIDIYLGNWYDGCDSPMDELTKDEFIKEQKNI